MTKRKTLLNNWLKPAYTEAVNTNRSEAFIKLKQSIAGCKNINQLKGILGILINVTDNNEYLTLVKYYQAKESELSLDNL
jgi:hypothetical protein